MSLPSVNIAPFPDMLALQIGPIGNRTAPSFTFQLRILLYCTVPTLENAYCGRKIGNNVVILEVTSESDVF